METINSPARSRVWILIWLLISQFTGLLVALGPVIAIVGVSAFITLLGGWSMVLVGFACVSFMLPVALALAAWIAFARRKDKAAAILSGVSLFVDILLYALVTWFTNSLN